MRVSPWAHWSFAVVVATAVTTVACDAHRDDRRTRAPEVAPRVAGLDAEASQMLAHVPVDTPYVWLNAEPLPDAYVERLAGLRDATLSGWARALDERTDDPELAALAAELRGRMNPAGLRALGFATNPRWVLYGLGLAPVLRLELDDGHRVARLLETIDAADGTSEVRTIAGHPVWTTSDRSHGFAGAVAIVDDALVVTIYPRAVEAELLPIALGVASTRRSFARSDALRVARRAHRLLPHGLAMLDLARIVELVAGEGDALERAVTRAWGIDVPQSTCAPALRQWIARAPRLWAGLREIDTRTIVATTIWELDDGLRDDLRGIVAPVPGQRRGDRDLGLASLGVGVDVGAAVAMLERWRDDDRLAACEDLARGLPDDPPPTWVTDLRGASAVLHDWDAARGRPSGVVVLGMDDPLAWLRTTTPSAALGPLRRRGHAAPLAEVAGNAGGSWLGEAWVARGRRALGLAAGDGARRSVARAVDDSSRDGDTLVTWSLDLAGLRALVPERRTRDDLEWVQAWAVLDAARRVRGTLEIGASGLELETIVDLDRR